MFLEHLDNPSTLIHLTPETIMSSTTSSDKPMKKRVSVACVKCRGRKVKCIPVSVPPQEPPRCFRCQDNRQECEYLSVAEQTEQMGRLTTPEQTDYYPQHGSGPVHPTPVTPLYSQPPPPAELTYSYPQQPFFNQPHPTPAYQNTVHQNAPPLSFSPPVNMSSGHQAFPYAPPRQASFYAQPSSPIRSRQDTSGNYGTPVYFDSPYQAQSPHQMPPNIGQQFYQNQQWPQGNN